MNRKGFRASRSLWVWGVMMAAYGMATGLAAWGMSALGYALPAWFWVSLWGLGLLFTLTAIRGLQWWQEKLTRKWRDQYFQLLDRLHAFDPSINPPVKFEASGFADLKDLAAALQSLTRRIAEAQQQQRHFMENASHELQTPLAVIRSNLELILQSESLGKEEVQRLAAALDAADKLSRINKSLILLYRIEHSQFGQLSSVVINDLVEENLALFAMEIEAKHLTLQTEFGATCTVRMNEVLADMVVKNLIQNAVRHNVDGGKLWVGIYKDVLKIRNTGLVLKVPEEKLFERFFRASDSEASLGLGLPIVKQICDSYGFRISYCGEGSQHTVTLNFVSPI